MDRRERTRVAPELPPCLTTGWFASLSFFFGGPLNNPADRRPQLG
jgi:hypothetical protein